MHAETDLVTAAERERITTMVDDLARQYRLADYGRLNYIRGLWERGCAYHHAGMLPAAKEIVEQLFTAGLIKLLFCTETFALGINMPAQTVIIDELEKFNGVDFSYLMTRTYNQIAGRAGRRGMDREGFVYAQVLPEVTDPREVERILSGNNERINSRFIASYSTILNLYSQVGDGVYDIFRRSLRNYRQGHFALTPAYEKEEVQIRNRLAFLKACGFLDGTHLTDKGRLAAAVNGYEIQAAELYSSRTFEHCTPPQIAVVMGGLVTEESSRTRRAGAAARPSPCASAHRPRKSSANCGGARSTSASRHPSPRWTLPMPARSSRGPTAAASTTCSVTACPRATSSALCA